MTDDRTARLHRISGALALAAFVVVHLLVQASALGGAARYASLAGALARSPGVGFLELLLVAAPFTVHAATGIALLRRGREDSRYGGRRAWVTQRAAAVVVLVFVLVHTWELRAQRLFFGLAPEGLYTTLTAHLSSTAGGLPWRALFYVLGTLAVAIHLANGLYAAVGRGRPRMRTVTVALGIAVFLVGTAIVVGLATGTRLLPAADDDSGPQAPCGSAVKPAPPPFPAPRPSR